MVEEDAGPATEVRDDGSISSPIGAAVIAGPNRVLGIVVSSVVLIAVVAGALGVARGETEYDPATPEGAVQAYVTAVIDGDHRAAMALVAEESPCVINDLDESSYGFDDSRVVLRETRVDGDEADVVVGIATSPVGDLLAGQERFERQTFRLVGGPGEWRLTGVPWPMYACGEGVFR